LIKDPLGFEDVLESVYNKYTELEEGGYNSVDFGDFLSISLLIKNYLS